MTTQELKIVQPTSRTKFVANVLVPRHKPQKLVRTVGAGFAKRG